MCGSAKQEITSSVAQLPFSSNPQDKYVLYDKGKGHYTVTLSGRVVRDSDESPVGLVHDLYTRILKEGNDRRLATFQVGPQSQDLHVRPHISLDWTTGSGRKVGCFTADPIVMYSCYLERSLEDIKAKFYGYLEEWDVSEAKAELERHIAQIGVRNRIANVVSFGTGSFQTMTGDNWRCSSFQVAAMITMLRILNKGRSMEHVASCFSQDPSYTDLDKEFLRSLGIKPVDDPDGFMLIGEDSLVCQWRIHGYVTRKINERPWPVVIISGSEELERPVGAIGQAEDTKYQCQITPPEARRIFDMLNGREQLSLAAIAHLSEASLDPCDSGNRFWEPTIYWRKGSVTESEGPESNGNGGSLGLNVNTEGFGR
ncbi:MAG: hypothetical protein Q9168_004045 [Polycauliona sp. 1 TL-2023]